MNTAYFHSLKPSLILTFILVLFVNFSSLKAQNTTKDDKVLLDLYETYSESPREVVYVHLNKSTYVNGEMLGFTAYIFDKFAKQRSVATTNLYCTISDLDGNVIKQKLVHVKDGIASNVFYLDETLLSGSFMFKAYTNWMFNFEEQNHFQQVFNVLDADTQTEIDSKTTDNQLDIQVLGEGGHLVFNTLNTAGVIVKNKSGKGLANATAELIDDTNQVISSFQLNAFGIAKIILNPEPGRRYFIKVYHNDHFEKSEISNIKTLGFNMTVTDLKDTFLVTFATNTASLKTLQKKRFKLAVHNGNEILIVPFFMTELSEKLMVYKSDVFTGINILTVFDEQNNPLLERMVFNHSGMERGATQFVSSIPDKDSLLIKLKVDHHQLNSFHNVSVSVLPSSTKSYNHHHNLISQIYLQPYIKTPIEHADYYFKDTSRKTKYQLDNLLLTQGWSSYNWTRIFNFESIYKYPFEQGISVTSNINGKTKAATYISYPLKSTSSKIYTITENDKAILSQNLVPVNDEQFRIGYLNRKGEPRAPTIYPQFYPSVFPKFSASYAYVQPEQSELTPNMVIPKTPSSWSDLEQLDEIVINAKKKKTKLQKLQEKKTKGRIFEINDDQRLRGTPLYIYLNEIGFVANYDLQNGKFTVTNPRVHWGNNKPIIYLDDAFLQEDSIDFLATLTLETIDYIDVEYHGFGGGIRGQAGYIKIYTSSEFFYRNDGKNNTVSSFDFPLTFDEDKQFYTPKYQFYNTTFFSEYGTIDWKPNLKADQDGMIRFKVKKLENESMNIYINGIVNNHLLLSEIKVIDTSNSN
ncbi:hypothetical protein [Psychroserpens sp. SPM9]|uniref:hypothetical protein n=1 Tax=Psychroserpens sp. SPM9 TaxID=2975598 RepID=UPI0021A530FB|nr:hypothetical protein [Psychroserpens sp. SPM9]MDG5490523.1 hypothetical protein [Psychroserpens sp. SPM9]